MLDTQIGRVSVSSIDIAAGFQTLARTWMKIAQFNLFHLSTSYVDRMRRALRCSVYFVPRSGCLCTSFSVQQISIPVTLMLGRRQS